MKSVIMNLFQQTVNIPFWLCFLFIILLLIAGNYCGSITVIEKIKQKKIKI